MTAWFLKFAAKLGFSALPGGGLVASLLSGASAVFGFLFEQISKAFADCLKNPRVFIVIGIALAAGNWYGWSNGYAQGEGDLETYKQQAVIYQKQADETADAAKAAKEAAKKAEAAKIASEKAKAESDKKIAAAEAEAATQKAEAEKAKATIKASTKIRAAARRARRAATGALSDIPTLIRRALGA